MLQGRLAGRALAPENVPGGSGGAPARSGEINYCRRILSKTGGWNCNVRNFFTTDLLACLASDISSGVCVQPKAVRAGQHQAQYVHSESSYQKVNILLRSGYPKLNRVLGEVFLDVGKFKFPKARDTVGFGSVDHDSGSATGCGAMSSAQSYIIRKQISDASQHYGICSDIPKQI